MRKKGRVVALLDQIHKEDVAVNVITYSAAISACLPTYREHINEEVERFMKRKKDVGRVRDLRVVQ